MKPPTEVTRYEALLLAFIGTLMATTGCRKDEATERVATLVALTEQQLNIRAVDVPAQSWAN